MVKLILVDYEDSFELFDKIDKAFEFCLQSKKVNEKVKIDLVDVNEDDIYYEEDGTLNYEDNSGLIKRGILNSIY
jgi:hypothetical protein